MTPCCGSPRKKSFIFENGTNVLAVDYSTALIKLQSTDESKFTIEEIGEYTWLCTFSKDVFVEFESPSEHRAQIHGPWILHCDKKFHARLVT